MFETKLQKNYKTKNDQGDADNARLLFSSINLVCLNLHGKHATILTIFT